MQSQTDSIAEALASFSVQGSEAPEMAARFLKSMAHRDRLKVLCVLLGGELSVAEIEAQVGASQSAVSQHLARLKEEGILSCRKDGRQVRYEIADRTVQGMIELLYLRFCAQ